MEKISKKKEESDKQESNEQQEEQQLTPWQKENLEYLKQQGDQPLWNPSVLKNKEESEQEDTEKEVEDDQETKEEPSEESEGQEKHIQTYESFADRLPNIKKVRNKRLYRRLTLIISVFFIAILIVFYFVSPLSKLSKVSVTGNQAVDAEKVIAQSNLEIGKSLWEQFGDRSAYEKKIQRQLPRVKKASISLSGIHSFTIKIQEYKVVALESTNGVFHPILENGKILSEGMSAPESGLPIFQNFTDQKIVKNLMNSYKKLPENLKQNISEIRYAPSKVNKELINLHMKDTNLVIVNISQLVEKMAYYEKVASQMEKTGTIDMEVGIFSYPFDSGADEESVEESSQPVE